ncbi:hypothetical protein BDZ90DRAFT_86362 [Jaminaea rosea]|uniref:Uncharacterized protein n=1 Tax=Jaminaea rosea TaxID=1569628 RepID=A0A316UJ26_9BASI|nr:hypothetical protein BDZ90DRAFT_86362 [Jaminaea rosea]PWN25266.1 hypothetical protein BDZ90DRAFT_86362 [Jaminaea rosea]
MSGKVAAAAGAPRTKPQVRRRAKRAMGTKRRGCRQLKGSSPAPRPLSTSPSPLCSSIHSSWPPRPPRSPSLRLRPLGSTRPPPARIASPRCSASRRTSRASTSRMAQRSTCATSSQRRRFRSRSLATGLMSRTGWATRSRASRCPVALRRRNGRTI